MEKFLYYTYALSLFLTPLIGGIFLMQDIPDGMGLLIIFIFVMLFIFWGTIAMTVSKALPQKLIHLVLTILITYGFYITDILTTETTWREGITNLGMLQIFVMMIGFTFAVFLGPWLTGARKKFSKKDWLRYIGTCFAELLFIIPGIVLITTTYQFLIKDWAMLATLIAMSLSMMKTLADISVYGKNT